MYDMTDKWWMKTEKAKQWVTEKLKLLRGLKWRMNNDRYDWEKKGWENETKNER